MNKECKECQKLMSQIEWDAKKLDWYFKESPLSLIRRAFNRFFVHRIERIKQFFNAP